MEKNMPLLYKSAHILQRKIAQSFIRSFPSLKNSKPCWSSESFIFLINLIYLIYQSSQNITKLITPLARTSQRTHKEGRARQTGGGSDFSKFFLEIKRFLPYNNFIMNRFEKLQTPDTSRERETIMENAVEDRGNLAARIFKSRVADLAGNFIPGIDIPKMAFEASIGKTSSSERLSKRQRTAYAIISGGTALAYTLQLLGMTAEAVTLRTAVAGLAQVEFGPEFLREAGEKARGKFPRVAPILEKTANYAAEKRELVALCIKNAQEKLRRMGNLEGIPLDEKLSL
ncbi:MAG: hypothetical protein UX72_C0034G0005 [Parcubacteria group bacterium GW2011_GWA2_47_10]|nr:MAG: hypothetical protein UX72_C0034G0005 [Parcubacteria group bacterium GW2011_GWA2_47_10]